MSAALKIKLRVQNGNLKKTGFETNKVFEDTYLAGRISPVYI